MTQIFHYKAFLGLLFHVTNVFNLSIHHMLVRTNLPENFQQKQRTFTLCVGESLKKQSKKAVQTKSGKSKKIAKRLTEKD